MSRVVTALFASIIATALVGGTAFMPTPAEAAKMSAADKAALRQKTADCKKQAKAKKLTGSELKAFMADCTK